MPHEATFVEALMNSGIVPFLVIVAAGMGFSVLGMLTTGRSS